MKLKHNSINYSVNTIDDLLNLNGMEENDVTVVADENRGGTFVYRSAEKDTNDGGTIFNGWCRKHEGAVNVKWFGAIGDGIVSDSDAIQSAIDYCRTLQTTSFYDGIKPTATYHFAWKIKLIFPPDNTFRLTKSLNMTKLSLAHSWLYVEAKGAVILLDANGTDLAGKAGIDMLGTRKLYWEGGTIISNGFSSEISNNLCKCGIQIGRGIGNAGNDYDSEYGDSNFFSGLEIKGYYSWSCIYNYAAEDNYYEHVGLKNGWDNSNAYCLIQDGSNYWGYNSDYVTTSPQNTPRSFLRNTFIRLDARKTNSGGAIWMNSQAWNHEFIASYVVAMENHAVKLMATPNSSGAVNKQFVDFKFDMHVEHDGGDLDPSTGLDYTFLFDSYEAASDIILENFVYKDNAAHAQLSVFKRSGNINNVAMYNTNIEIDVNRDVGQKLFDNSGSYTYSGKLSDMSYSNNFGIDYCKFYGEYICNDELNGQGLNAKDGYKLTSKNRTYTYQNSNYLSPVVLKKNYYSPSDTSTPKVVESINTDNGNYAYIKDGVNDYIRTSTAVYVGDDNVRSLGIAANRWSEIFAANATINTSDEREKTFLNIEDAEKDCALEIKKHIRKFQWNEALETKGEEARIHYGVNAQQVRDIFSNYGLDAHKYGLFTYDEWDEELDEDGNVIIEAGNRYGIRYSELLCFIIGAM